MNSVDDIQKLIASASKLVGHFNCSSVAAQELKKVQHDLFKFKNNDNDTIAFQPLSLIQYCRTRWNSIESMLRRLKDVKDSLLTVLGNSSIVKTKVARNIELTTEQWRMIEDILPTLKVLKTSTELFSYEKQPSLSSVYPIIFTLLCHLRVQLNDECIVKTLKSNLHLNLDVRFKISSCETSPAIIATALDPRYKNLNWLSVTQKEHVKKTMENYYNILKSKMDTETPASIEARLHMDDEEDTFFDVSFENSGEINIVNNEFDEYFSARSVDRKSCPLMWWREQEKMFPMLAKLARKYLCIPASSVASERHFSTAGRIIRKDRVRLLPETSATLIFLNRNKSMFF